RLPAVSFCLPLRRSSRSTLFPYTTLFRSLRQHGRSRRGRGGGERRQRHLGRRVCAAGRGSAEGVRAPGGRAGVRGLAADRRPAADRKSTRLNSSHVKISYAVFCLKKKSIR